jgi:adenylyltransferase/sulfurtransferase
MIKTISVKELKARLDGGDKIFILDVREASEYQICNLGGRRIGMSELDIHLSEIPKDQEVVVHCHHGMRSLRAIEFLSRNHGFRNLVNLTGGIHAWAEEIEQAMTKY